jgi:hypothetical protein
MDVLARKVRRLEMVVGGLGLLVGLLLFSGATRQRELVEARRFNVVDEHDRVVGTFGAEGGAVNLGLLDGKGRPRVSLGLEPDGSAVVAVSGADRPVVALGVRRGKEASVEVVGAGDRVLFRAP